MGTLSTQDFALIAMATSMATVGICYGLKWIHDKAIDYFMALDREQES